MARSSLLQMLIERLNPQRPPNMVQQATSALQRAAAQLQQARLNVPLAQLRMAQASRRYGRSPTRQNQLREYQATLNLRAARRRLQEAQQQVEQARFTQQGQTSGAIPLLQGLQGALQAGSPSQFLSQLGGGLSKLPGSSMGSAMLGTVGGGLSKLAWPVAMAEVGWKAVEALKAFSAQAHESNIKLADWSAGMSKVAYESELRQILLQRWMGDELAPSAQRLAEAQDASAKAWAPIAVGIRKEWNNFLAGFNEALKSQGEMIRWMGGEDPKKIREESNKNDADEGMQSIMEQMEVDQWYEQYGRPIRFGGRGP